MIPIECLQLTSVPPLTEKESSLIQAWIASGAKYSKHWSFDRVSTSSRELGSPELNDLAKRYPKWQHSSIDSFVLKKLQQRGWEPSPEADRLTLLRRVTLDLTGLPPSIEQQTAFASDTSDLAYERLVDELLATPAFGEHWGRKWLDLARYADSAGYADDPQRTIWAYRDWVIRAINEGKSFDAFTIEQLAGDLLPNPTDDQLVATAFHRNTLTNNEGGTNDEEFRNVAIVDRVNTTMAVWMGLTMACAQCHSHKFDPISQKEYFQVFAILNQTQDADRGDESPILQWFSPEQRRDRLDTHAKLAAVESSLTAPDPKLMDEQRAWGDHFRRPLEFQTLVPVTAVANSASTIAIQATGQIKVDANSDNDSFTLEFPLPSELALDQITGVQLKSIPDPSLPNQGAAIGNGNFVLTQVSASVAPQENSSVKGRFVRIDLEGASKILSLAEVQVFSNDQNLTQGAKAKQSSTDFGGPAERAIDGKTSGIYAENSTTHCAISDSPWWEVDLGKAPSIDKIVVWNRTDPGTEARLAGAKITVLSEDRQPVWTAMIEQPKASQAFEMRTVINVPWLAANADHAQDGFPASHAIDGDLKTGWAVGGAVDKPHELRIALSGQEWKKRIAAQPLTGPSILRLTIKFESVHLRAVLASFAIGLTTDPRAEPMIGLPVNVAKLLAADPSSISAADAGALHVYYVSKVAPSRQTLRDQRAALSKRLAENQPTSTVPILRELPADKYRTTQIQQRGNYKVLGDAVSAGVPSAFNTWKPETKDGAAPVMNRLEFAKWIMADDNPLTARVLANRTWETLFGVGIVRTSEEFGSQGDLPTNPELLDHLALQLIRSGWDTKRFIRNIVLSAAYRQRSSVTPQRYEEDPENVYLSRGPRFRVTAEQIRDMALASAGLLSQKLYGPPTRPPQPSLGLSAAFGSKTDWDSQQRGKIDFAEAYIRFGDARILIRPWPPLMPPTAKCVCLNEIEPILRCKRW